MADKKRTVARKGARKANGLRKPKKLEANKSLETVKIAYNQQ